MDDDSQLLERVKEVGTAVWTVVGLITGSPGITTGDAIAPRLMLSHDELKRIRSSVQSIALGVLVIAVATVASVWRHW